MSPLVLTEDSRLDLWRGLAVEAREVYEEADTVLECMYLSSAISTVLPSPALPAMESPFIELLAETLIAST